MVMEFVGGKKKETPTANVSAKMPADPNKQCGLTFVSHKQWKAHN